LIWVKRRPNQTPPRPKTLRPYLSSNTAIGPQNPTLPLSRPWHRRAAPKLPSPHSAHPETGAALNGRCPAKLDGVPESSRMSKLTMGSGRSRTMQRKSCVDGFRKPSPLQLSGLCRPGPSTGCPGFGGRLVHHHLADLANSLFVLL
jgi:hypothetical protein